MATVIAGVPSIGLPVKPGYEDATPGRTKRRAIILNEATSRAVFAACQARNFHVVAMVNTAMLLAIASFPQHPLAKNSGSLVPVDLRRYILSPYDQSAAAYAFAQPLVVANVADKNFEELAREVNAVYRMDFSNLTMDDSGRPVGIAQTTGCTARAIDKLLTAPLPPGLHNT